MIRFVVAALLLVVVAGCSDPEPVEPSATPTPTVTVPTMPPQAKENTPEGAAAFVNHYIDVLNYASNTGDVEELSRLSDPRCSGCQKYIELYSETYADGGEFKGGNWTTDQMRLDFGEPETYVTTTIKVAASEYRKPPSPPVAEAASSSKVSFGIAGDPWMVTQLGLGDTE